MGEIFGIILDEKIILLAKALILIFIGLLAGLIANKLLLKFLDSHFLRKMFGKDVPTYEASIKISKIICMIIQFSISLLFINYALILLNFDLISKIFYYILAEIPKISFFILIILSGFLIAKMVVSQIRNKDINKKEEIALVIEAVIITAFFLTGIEFIGIKATALIELYKVFLYIIAATIIILVLKPEFFETKRKIRKHAKK